MAQSMRRAYAAPRAGNTIRVARGSRKPSCLRCGGDWTIFLTADEPFEWYSGGDIPNNCYGNFWRGLALRDRHTYGYVIIVSVLLPGLMGFPRGVRGIGCPCRIWRATGVCVRLLLLGLLLAGGSGGGPAVRAQEAPPNPQPPAAPADLPGEVVQNPTGPCVQPPPMVQLQDYNGPFHKVIGTFTQKLDRLSVRDPHYKPGVVLCSLEIKDKFFLFLRDSVDPETFLSAGFDAGISQAENDDPSFGQGGKGYAKRYGAGYTDEVQFRFFKEFTYPTIFSEDPRYYRMGQGAKGRRFMHAVAHAVVAYNDNGRPIFNYSEWLGEISGTSLSNLYHPGARRGFAPAARSVAIDVALDIGYDELREFWPEVARKLRLPFRDQNEPPPNALPAGR
jgi:hypothetical protein